MFTVTVKHAVSIRTAESSNLRTAVSTLVDGINHPLTEVSVETNHGAVRKIVFDGAHPVLRNPNVDGICAAVRHHLN